MNSPRRILVTGATGFAGRHLMAALEGRFPDAVLLPLGGPRDPVAPLDVTDASACRAVLAAAKPDAIIHLGGAAAVAAANADPAGTMAVNGIGSRNLILAALAEAPSSTFVLVSSSEVYGASLEGGAPTPETAPCRPLSPYAESKWAAEEAAREAAGDGLHVLIARPFNHTGPGQSTAFVVPAFAAQVAAAEAGDQAPVIEVGWLTDVRDFTDVRDTVAGYASLLAHADSLAPGTAINFATGRAWTIGEVLDQLVSLSTVKMTTRQDPGRLRPGRLPAMVGEAGLAARVLGWRPKIAFSTTLMDVLAAARGARQSRSAG